MHPKRWTKKFNAWRCISDYWLRALFIISKYLNRRPCKTRIMMLEILCPLRPLSICWF